MSYSSLNSHRLMVFDQQRNSSYAEAMGRLITPDSVVLDLGAGLGILGLLAAAAGARRVYLVEPEAVVRNALELARSNGLADRITVLQGRIEEVELPEKVDLIISVFTGNLLFSEDLLPSLFHARDRYLKPGGHMLPDMAELVVAPVSAPKLHKRDVGVWSESNMALDFSVFRRFAANELIWLKREEARPQQLAAAMALTTVDLRTAQSADCSGKLQGVVTESGLCHGLLGWIRIRLDQHWLSSAPDAPLVHWSQALLPVDPPLPLVAGETVSISLQRPLRGDWTWSLAAQAGERRHSTFLARFDGPAHLQKIAPANSAPLNGHGKALLHALTMMQAGHSNATIANSLGEQWPDSFPVAAEALAFVQKVALQSRSR